jgi:RNA polymerase sigma-70 factor (ECF subfamily)
LGQVGRGQLEEQVMESNNEFEPRVMVQAQDQTPLHSYSRTTFEELAMPLFGSLYNFAHWLAQTREDAEDLVQETFVKALRGYGSFQPETNFRAWIFQILRNTFLSSQSRLERRKTARLDPDETSLELSGAMGTAESSLIERADADLVLHEINQLLPAFREVLLLCDVEEMSYKEIAEVLSIPIGTVMSRLTRARKAVREALAVTTRVRLASRNSEVASGTEMTAQG